MKKLIRIKKSERGFTLLEVIITIVIAAILGSFLITFMGTAITRSSDPIFQVQNRATAEGTMEVIVADYATHLAAGNSTSWSNFKNQHIAVTTNTINNTVHGSNFETIEVTITEGNQKFVSYFSR
jgi:prepilin-type N-terminal cleavage/methylation domain-containing protein